MNRAHVGDLEQAFALLPAQFPFHRELALELVDLARGGFAVGAIFGVDL